MIGFPLNLKILVALEPCDLRKSFNGLVVVADSLKEEGLQSGTLFIFTNKRRNRIKVLYYDRAGICILAKRLEIGTFSWPRPSDRKKPSLSLSPEALQLLLDGIDLHSATMRPWYDARKK
ncbi:MAG: transposase [Paracoccaceae bacterium]|jgi:transposase